MKKKKWIQTPIRYGKSKIRKKNNEENLKTEKLKN